MKRLLKVGLFLILAAGIVWFPKKPCCESTSCEKPEPTPEGRFEFELMRLADPATGEIPDNIRMRELAYASKLPKRDQNAKSGSQDFVHIGPYNVGGRTRALAIDVANTSTYFAGGVSGGLWKSTNEGVSWYRVTKKEDHAAVSCIAQDVRSGKTNIWYYGSGESIGNSASKSFSAYYRGSGMYKSTDGGETWTVLSETSGPVNSDFDWEFIYRIAVDPVRQDSDIIYAAIKTGIVRSNDGGQTWRHSLEVTPDANFTEVKITSTGILYATVSSDAQTGQGFWRSTDGFNWTNIRPSNYPGSFQRTLMDIPSSNEDLVFYFGGTNGAGANGYSLWKYEYLSGNGAGSGGNWTNLTPQIPDTNINIFNGYCMVIKVKPDDPDVIFIGGNNLYRSTTGFRDTINNFQVGGNSVYGDTTFHNRSGRQHADQQNMVFHPTDPDILLSSTDGGVHRTLNPAGTVINWESLNNGYVTSQFYGIALDHGTEGSEVVIGGLQDQGTYWTNSHVPVVDWVSVRGADGAHVAVEDGGGAYYVSTQYANIRRMIFDSVGGRISSKKVMPPSLPTGSGSELLFVHPFTLDPVDNTIMYLPYDGDVWRNTDLPAADSGDLSTWREISTGGGLITAIAASESEQGVVYYGTSNRRIYRLDNAHTANQVAEKLISGDITVGSYTSCVAIDPNDADKVIVVYSNYNTISLWYTEDAGDNWKPIEGNLRGNADPSLPDQFYYISDGPSVRWAEIIPTSTGNRYFLGTSVGVFSTNLLQGDSTIWVQEGAETIGNVVVDMLDYRHSDQMMIAGTHGNGIYATNVIKNFLSDEINVDEPELDWSVFPNPTFQYVNVTFDLPKQSLMEVSILNGHGKLMQHLPGRISSSGVQTMTLDLFGYPAGIYYISILSDGHRYLKKVIKH